MSNVEIGDLKTLQEALRVALVAMMVAYPNDRQHEAQRLTELLEAVDEARPLGPDGKHGNRHTYSCGCEDAIRSIENLEVSPCQKHRLHDAHRWVYLHTGSDGRIHTNQYWCMGRS